MNHLESEHQRAYFEWARLHFDARSAFAIPNGGRRNPREAARLKAEGVTAGVLDVFLPKARGGCHGLWLEFKAGKSSPTIVQAERADALVRDGYAVAVVYSSGAGVEATQHYLAGRLGPCLLVMG